MTLTHQEKAWQLLERVNGQPISEEDWQRCSEYAKSDLKRKTKLIPSHILENIDWHEFETPNALIDYWTEVEKEIDKA